ncbi:MAG: exoribonuclease R [Candidatus Poriferisodalaceae bacterium]|jgi:exoribonuclease R
MSAVTFRFPTQDEFHAGFDTIRTELDIEDDFGPEVEQELSELGVGLSAHRAVTDVADRRDIDLITVDPPTSMDLDQAFHAERRGDGYRVFYAIADPAAFITPDGPLDIATRGRGVTYYAPDRNSPLHPRPLSEHAASLLPDVDRPSVLWTIDLDSSGERTDVHFGRALVRSRAKLSYSEVQQRLDNGDPTEQLQLLREIGTARQILEQQRGGVSINLPSQEVVRTDSGYRLEHDESLPVENWNAQISLLAGMTAGSLMLDAGIGLLRTLPPPPQETLDEIRLHARGLGVSWAPHVSYPDRVRQLNPALPADVALLSVAVRALRGASYLALDGPTDESTIHWAIGADYAHVTAPLRRVGDRFANEALLSIMSGQRLPNWVDEALPQMPSLLNKARRRESQLDRAIIDFAEALILEPMVGHTFPAIVTGQRRDGDAIIQIADPAVSTVIDAQLEPGTETEVRLVSAHPAKRTIRFELA